MERRNFFKKLGCLIAGVAVAPVVIKTNELNDYEKALREETDRQAEYLAKVFITDPNFMGQPSSWMRGGWNCNSEYIPMYSEDLPGIVNGKAESKERFELRKAIYRPITDKLVKKIING